MEFCEIISLFDKTTSSQKTSCRTLVKQPVARKLAVGHLCVGQLVFRLLVVSSFNYFNMHAWSTSMLLLLHSAFMLSEVKMLLKGEVLRSCIKWSWKLHS